MGGAKPSKSKRGLIRLMPNLYESPAETSAEADPYLEKVEKIGMTIPTVIAYAVVLPLIIITALQGTRVYTVTCTGGRCDEPSGLLDAARMQAQARAGVDSSGSTASVPVTLADFERYTQMAESKGVRLTCPCQQTNIEFETFSSVDPKQIRLCGSLLNLFFPPLSLNATTTKVTFGTDPTDESVVQGQYIDTFGMMAFIVRNAIQPYQFKLFYNLCDSASFLTGAFLNTFRKTRLLTPNILAEDALAKEVTSRITPLNGTIAGQFLTANRASASWIAGALRSSIDIIKAFDNETGVRAYATHILDEETPSTCSCDKDWSCVDMQHAVTGNVAACDQTTNTLVVPLYKAYKAHSEYLCRNTDPEYNCKASIKNMFAERLGNGKADWGVPRSGDWIKFICETLDGPLGRDPVRTDKSWGTRPDGSCFFSGPGGQWTEANLIAAGESFDEGVFEYASFLEAISNLMLLPGSIENTTVVNYSAYIDQCAAEECTYTYTGRNDWNTVLTQVIAQFGLAQMVVTSFFATVVRNCAARKKKHQVDAEPSNAGATHEYSSKEAVMSVRSEAGLPLHEEPFGGTGKARDADASEPPPLPSAGGDQRKQNGGKTASKANDLTLEDDVDNLLAELH